MTIWDQVKSVALTAAWFFSVSFLTTLATFSNLSKATIVAAITAAAGSVGHYLSGLIPQPPTSALRAARKNGVQ